MIAEIARLTAARGYINGCNNAGTLADAIALPGSCVQRVYAVRRAAAFVR